MKKLLVLVLFFGCLAPAFAQKSVKDINAYRAQKMDEILKIKIDAAKEDVSSQAAWYNGSASSVMYYFRDHFRAQRPAQTGEFLRALFEENDLVLYGENHSYPLPKVLAVKNLIKYNQTAPKGKRVTHVFFEYPPQKKAEFMPIEQALAPLDSAQKQAYCKALSYKEKFLKGSVDDFIYCELTRSGVRVEFADLPSQKGAGENKCCQYLGTCLAGTDMTVFSTDGMTLRNCRMLDVISKALAKGGKGVLFVGYGHIPYEFTDYDGAGLGLMARRGLKNKKVTAVIATGGAQAKFDSIEICSNCMTREIKQGPLPHPEFYLFLERDMMEDNVLDVVPAGKEREAIYKHRPADKVIMFSRYYDFYGVAEEDYAPRH